MKMSDFYSPKLLEAVSKNPVQLSEYKPTHREPLTEGRVPLSAGVENEEIRDLLNRLNGILHLLKSQYSISKIKGEPTMHMDLKENIRWQKTINKAIKVIESEWL